MHADKLEELVEETVAKCEQRAGCYDLQIEYKKVASDRWIAAYRKWGGYV